MAEVTIIRHSKKIVLLGAIAILIQMVVFSLLWLNPWVKSITDQVATHPNLKSYGAFGGVNNWMMLRTTFLVAFSALYIYLFVMLYSSIPGQGWLKGVVFGLTMGVIKNVPEAFNQWTLIVYPHEQVLLQLVNGIVGFAIFGLIMALLFNKFGAIESAQKE